MEGWQFLSGRHYFFRFPPSQRQNAFVRTRARANIFPSPAPRFHPPTDGKQIQISGNHVNITSTAEMSGDSLMFDEFIALCDEQYEYGLIEFKNGDAINGPGENDGSAKVLSYAALANFDKDMTLKVSTVAYYFQL